jgi:two-component system sensor histidine kinase CpxA
MGRKGSGVMFPKISFALSTKIFFIALLNLLLIASVLGVFMRVQYRFDLQSFLISPAHDRILSTGRQIALELRDTDRSGWDQLLQRYEGANKVDLRLTDDDGRHLAGRSSAIPEAVLASLNRQAHDGNRNSPLLFLGSTRGPLTHWVGVRIPVPSPNERHHIHGVLIAASSSLIGTPFFFDPKPWIAVAFALILISVLCWLPFGRSMVSSVSRINRAAAQIAEGQFKIQLPVKRRDELGQLSASINRLTLRLDGFVAGQKRFLGDTAHELCSPLARMQVAVSILERSTESDLKGTVDDLRDDLQHMTNLVNDVLAFSKAGLRGPDVQLNPIALGEIVGSVLEREGVKAGTFQIRVSPQIRVLAHRDLLDRALSNVVRNAMRYAGTAGPIVISASPINGSVIVCVSDRGPGLPDSELDRIFDPFYRLEYARSSETGGAGLGLAIVKSSVEACGGRVACRNLPERGLAVEITLKAA